MSLDEVIENALFDYCVAWRDRGHAIQDRIERDLCTAIEQHVAEAVARERQAIEKICEEFGAWNKTASEILDAIYDRSGKEPKP